MRLCSLSRARPLVLLKLTRSSVCVCFSMRWCTLSRARPLVLLKLTRSSVCVCFQYAMVYFEQGADAEEHCRTRADIVTVADHEEDLVRRSCILSMFTRKYRKY